MPQYRFQTLNQLQIFDVLRAAAHCRLAVERDGQPWCVPIACQMEVCGTEVFIHVAMTAGRKLEALAENDRVCLEFERPGCAWLDTVILTGRAAEGVCIPGQALHLRIRARELSGRRYFLPAEEDGAP